MEGFFGVIVFGILAITILGFVGRFFRSGIPSTGESDYDSFVKSLPDGFNNYVYYNNGTGYALDLDNNRIFIQSGSDKKIYNYNDIREITRSIVEAAEWYTTNSRPSLSVALKNREEKRKAYDRSGIFISVKDIDHPTWQIKYIDDSSLGRSWEILHQFLDGDLQRRK